MGPLSLDDVKTWLQKAMADLIQCWGFLFGLETFWESFQPKLLGISGELQFCSIFPLIGKTGVMSGQCAFLGVDRLWWASWNCRVLKRRQKDFFKPISKESLASSCLGRSCIFQEGHKCYCSYNSKGLPHGWYRTALALCDSGNHFLW